MSSLQGKLWLAFIVLGTLTFIATTFIHSASIAPGETLMSELGGDVASIEFMLHQEEWRLNRAVQFIADYLAQQTDLLERLRTDTLDLYIDPDYVQQQKHHYHLDVLVVAQADNQRFSDPTAVTERLYHLLAKAETGNNVVSSISVVNDQFQWMVAAPIRDGAEVYGSVAAVRTLTEKSPVIQNMIDQLPAGAFFQIISDKQVLISSTDALTRPIIDPQQLTFTDLRLDTDIVQHQPIHDQHYVVTYRALADGEANIVAAIVYAQPNTFLSLWKRKTFQRALAAIFLIIMILPLSIGAMTHDLSTSLVELKAKIVQVLQNNLDIRAKVPNNEVGEIAADFNVIVDRMNELVADEREKRAELSKLNAIARSISGVVEDLDMLRHMIMEKTIDAIEDVTHFELFLKNEEKDELEVSVSGSAGVGAPISREVMELGEQIAGKVVSEATPLIVNSIEERHNLPNPNNIHTCLLSVPLTTRGMVIGAINLYSTRLENGFTENDLTFMMMIAGQASISLDNASLYRKVAEQERMGKELEITNEIRKEILPQTTPNVPHLTLSAAIQRVRTHGGDYYDYIHHGSDDTVGLVLADVTARGVQAGILTIIMRMAIHASAEYIQSPREMVLNMYNVIKDNMSENTLVKISYAIWDGPARKLTFCSAGQPHLLIYRAESELVIEYEFSKTGALGAETDLETKLTEYSASFQPGDSFLFFTDGARTARNTAHEWFSVTDIKHALQDYADRTAEEIQQGITQQILDHIQDARQDDDFTLLVGKVS